MAGILNGNVVKDVRGLVLAVLEYFWRTFWVRTCQEGVLLLRPFPEYDADKARNSSADRKNNCHWSWEANFCIDKCHSHSDSDQTERDSESAAI